MPLYIYNYKKQILTIAFLQIPLQCTIGLQSRFINIMCTKNSTLFTKLSQHQQKTNSVIESTWLTGYVQNRR